MRWPVVGFLHYIFTCRYVAVFHFTLKYRLNVFRWKHAPSRSSTCTLTVAACNVTAWLISFERSCPPYTWATKCPTTRSRILIQTLIVVNLVKNLPVFYRTRSFIAMFRRLRLEFILNQVNLVHIFSCCYVGFILILYSYPRPCLPQIIAFGTALFYSCYILPRYKGYKMHSSSLILYLSHPHAVKANSDGLLTVISMYQKI